MEKFEIFIDASYFKKGEILKGTEETFLEVLSTPTIHYSKWYWRILNFLTFKKWFNVKYTYTVKMIENEIIKEQPKKE